MKQKNKKRNNRIYKILAFTLMPTLFITFIVLFMIDSFTDYINIFNSNKPIGIAFCVGLFIGLIVVIWYPVKVLIQWNKKRKLTNKNLKLDIAIKEKQLAENEPQKGDKTNE